jgi:hypothetical protein
MRFSIQNVDAVSLQLLKIVGIRRRTSEEKTIYYRELLSSASFVVCVWCFGFCGGCVLCVLPKKSRKRNDVSVYSVKNEKV